MERGGEGGRAGETEGFRKCARWQKYLFGKMCVLALDRLGRC